MVIPNSVVTKHETIGWNKDSDSSYREQSMSVSMSMWLIHFYINKITFPNQLSEVGESLVDTRAHQQTSLIS